MDVFTLRNRLVDDYSAFARSFTTIRAADLKNGIDDAYASNRYWPDPLIQINPSYKLSQTTAELAADGTIWMASSRLSTSCRRSHYSKSGLHLTSLAKRTSTSSGAAT